MLDRGGPAPGPDHRRIGWVAALVALAIHLPVLTRYGWFRDELYYVACAARLDWGYVDHPPLSIALLALVHAVFGDSLAAIRLTAALAGAATVWLACRLAREFGGGAFAQALTGLAAIISPMLLGITRFYSMNALEMLLWTAASLALVRALRAGQVSHWVVLGLLVGLGLLNKISTLWFLGGIAAGLLLTSHRRALATPGPWLAAGIAFTMLSPHVVWQEMHDWPTAEFMRNATGAKMAKVPLIGFLSSQFMTLGPGNVLVALPGLAFALFAAAGRPWRVLALSVLTVAAILVAAGTSRASYLAGTYPVMFALGGLAWERWSQRHPRAIRVPLVLAVTLLTLPLAPFAIPLLPVESFLRYQSALGITPSTEERKRVGPLSQGYADMFGWPELVAAVAIATERLTPDERRRAVVFGQNYGQAGAVEVLGRKLDLPRAVSGHNNYGLWGPGAWDGGVMIIIGGDPEDNASFFQSLEHVGVTDHPYAMPYERGVEISIGRGFRYLPPGSVWSRVVHYN
jgi:hypothetical protein